MSSLAELVADLPPRVHRAGRARSEPREQLRAAFDAEYGNWLKDLYAEEAARGQVLPCERPQRLLDPRALEEGALADLIIEKNRCSRGFQGPAPATRDGLRATLRSFIDAREPCDRYDALIRHAATALRLAEEISAGRA